MRVYCSMSGDADAVRPRPRVVDGPADGGSAIAPGSADSSAPVAGAESAAGVAGSRGVRSSGGLMGPQDTGSGRGRPASGARQLRADAERPLRLLGGAAAFAHAREDA